MRTFRKNLDERLEKFIKGKTKPATKDVFKRIIEDSADELIYMEMESLKEAFLELDKLDEKLYAVSRMTERIEGLMDDRAKTAMILYERAKKEEEGDDNFAKCRRITAAGLIAASYLGLKQYEVSNHGEMFNKQR